MTNGPQIDLAVESKALREAGILGRGGGMGNSLHAIDHSTLPPEAHATIEAIIRGGPFPYRQDGSRFSNRFGDLPSSGDYMEFTVPTPGASNRGARRIVAHKGGVLFFTACHYERVQGRMTNEERQAATAAVDEQWRNGFYVVTGMKLSLRQSIAAGVARLRAARP